jgi:hypothetical protein
MTVLQLATRDRRMITQARFDEDLEPSSIGTVGVPTRNVAQAFCHEIWRATRACENG